MTIERKPLRRREYIGVQDLIGGVECIHEAMAALSERATETGAMDTLLKAHDTAVEAYEQILASIPADKLVRIRKDLDNTRVYVKVEAPGIKTMDSKLWRYVPAEVLNRLVDYVAKSECFFCDKSKEDGRKCQIRQMMEDAMPHELEYKSPDGCCEWSGLVLGMEDASK